MIRPVGTPQATIRPGESCLVAIYGPELGRRVPLTGSGLTVGRDSARDLVIEVEDVSRLHCSIHVRGDAVYLRDEGSTNGTLVNDRPVRPKVDTPLSSGDRIQMAGAIFKFLAGGDVESLYHEEIYRTTIVDGLTQAYNRRYFEDFLTRELARSKRHSRPLALILLDIDHFKQINDTYGHPAGDHVLRELSASIRASIRREECFARYGGEEFALVCPETWLQAALGCAERLRALAERLTLQHDGRDLSVTISVGAACLEAGMQSPNELITATDRCLYEAKEGGRNAVVSRSVLPRS